MRCIVHFSGKTMAPLKLIVSAAAVLLVSAAHAGLTSKAFSAHYAYPDLTTIYGSASATPSTFVVGPGVETHFEVEGVTDISVDFSDTSLTLVLTTQLDAPTWNDTSFNGPVFDRIAGGPLDIVSATIDSATTMGGFDASRVSFGADRIAINWHGLSYVDGTRVVVHFTSAVPEPSTWALAALGGLAFLGAHRSARRRPRRPPPALAA